MKVSEIIQRVESLFAKGIALSLSDYIARPWIYNMLVCYRSKLLGQKLNKKQRISSWNKQTLRCIELIDMSSNECTCESGLCTVKRTKEKLPELMLGLSDYAIESIYTNDNSYKIDLVKANEAKYLAYSKYSKDRITAYINDGYLYLNGHTHIDSINVTGLFEDPWEAHKWEKRNGKCVSEDENYCDPMKFEFPLDNDLIDTCVQLCANELSMAFLKQQQQQEQQQQENNEA